MAEPLEFFFHFVSSLGYTLSNTLVQEKKNECKWSEKTKRTLNKYTIDSVFRMDFENDTAELGHQNIMAFSTIIKLPVY